MVLGCTDSNGDGLLDFHAATAFNQVGEYFIVLCNTQTHLATLNYTANVAEWLDDTLSN
jgi:hypothetical protein